MNQIIGKCLLVGVLFWVGGCTNYLIRKDCEKINWFNHGQDLALRGKRINQDDVYLNCKKAEAEISFSQLDMGWKEGRGSYCTPEGATVTGKKGEPLNLELCDAGQTRILKERYQSGLRYFCHPKNAYTFGTSGKVYDKICPEDMEADFQVEYRKGRQKYLTEMVRQSQVKIQNLENGIREEERKKTTTALMLATLPPPTKVINSVYDPVTQSYKQTQTMNDPNEARRRDLNQQLQMSQTNMSKMGKDKEQETAKMFEFQKELNTMEIPQP